MLCFGERKDMGKTYKRNQQFRPKKHGKTFTKDQPWKNKKDNKNPPIDIPPDVIMPDSEFLDI